MTISPSTNRIRNGTFDLCLQMVDAAKDLKDARALIVNLQDFLNNAADEYNERVKTTKRTGRK